MAKRKEKEVKLNKQDQKLYAFLASFFTVIGFIVASILWKDDKYVMHYAKQGLVLFVAQVLIVVLGFFMFFLSSFLWVFWVILWIITWLNSFSGKMKKTLVREQYQDSILMVAPSDSPEFQMHTRVCK